MWYCLTNVMCTWACVDENLYIYNILLSSCLLPLIVDLLKNLKPGITAQHSSPCLSTLTWYPVLSIHMQRQLSPLPSEVSLGRELILIIQCQPHLSLVLTLVHHSMAVWQCSIVITTNLLMKMPTWWCVGERGQFAHHCPQSCRLPYLSWTRKHSMMRLVTSSIPTFETRLQHEHLIHYTFIRLWTIACINTFFHMYMDSIISWCVCIVL